MPSGDIIGLEIVWTNFPGLPTHVTAMNARDADEIQKIEGFKKGYVSFIEGQTMHAKAAQQLLSSAVFAPDEKRTLQDVLPAIDKELSAIQTTARQLLMELNQSNLERDAARDYHAFFKGDVQEHHLSYIVFMKTYILLARFVQALSESWKRIRDLVTESKLADNSEFRRQLLHFRVGPVLLDIESLRLFVSRMGLILQLQRDPLATRDIAGAGKYRDDMQYQLSSVFIENLAAQAGGAPLELSLDLSGLSSTSARPAAAVATPAPARITPVLVAGKETYRLNAGGTQPWNTTPYYYFTYDPRALDAERAKFTNIIHIDTHMGADHNVMRSERILKYSRKVNEHDLRGNVEQEYCDFLNSFFNLVIEITCLNMAMPPKMRSLFLFHLGPQSFYFLTRRFLQELDTGTIHRKSGKGSVIEKFTPAELVKKVMLEWWQAYVIHGMGSERDDIAQYKVILKIVKETYDRLSAKAMQEYDQMPEAEKKRRNRSEIIRENLNKWLGPTNIIVFRRFLKGDTQ